jgi:hypothetical protein
MKFQYNDNGLNSNENSVNVMHNGHGSVWASETRACGQFLDKLTNCHVLQKGCPPRRFLCAVHCTSFVYPEARIVGTKF